MNLIDALCVIASSWNTRSPAEERVYKEARELVEEHAEGVMMQKLSQALRAESDQLLVGLESFNAVSNRVLSSGAIQ
jgi:hypothetical protein